MGTATFTARLEPAVFEPQGRIFLYIGLYLGLFGGVLLIGACGNLTPAMAEPLQEYTLVTDNGLGALTRPSTDVPTALQPFNNTMLSFNYDYFDLYVLSPVTEAYGAIVEEGEQQLIHNVLDNISTPKRLLNNLLQGKFLEAGKELSRLLINSTLGGAGMADVARYQFGIERCNADFGHTLEVWGWTESSDLVMPFMPPMTIRDGVGFVVDRAMNPVTYVFPIPFVGALAKDTLQYINDGGLHPKVFDGNQSDRTFPLPLPMELINTP